MVAGEGNVIVDTEECGFSGMEAAISGLKGSDGGKGVEVRGQASFDDALKNLGDEVEVGYWPVAG
jgi:hypothetical protein